MGDKYESYEISKKIVSEHPDYLDGRLNLAAEYHTRGEYEKMPELIGESMELKDLCPLRIYFHLQEVLRYLTFSIMQKVKWKNKKINSTGKLYS